MKKYAFGVDIGGTSIKVGFFEINGKLLETWKIPTNIDENGSHILQDIADTVKQKLELLKIPKQEVLGIGMGVPGPISEDGKVLKCVNLGWGVFNVVDVLEDLTGLKVKVGNDANVAALGEFWQGGGKGHKNIVMVTLGTGVGGSVIIDGKIVSGVHGAAGEIGHLHMIDDEHQTCGCGKKGCLEQYASANGLVRLTREYLQSHPSVVTCLHDIDKITAEDIFEAAKNKDEVALQMVNKVCEFLGKALAQISCVINPEVLVIGGGMSKAGDILLENIQKYFIMYAFHASRNTRFKEAKLSNDAGIYGGVKLIIDN